MQGKFLYGRQMIDEDIEIGRDETIGKCADGIVFLQFSNIHKISPSVFNEAGFMLQPFVFGSYRTSDYYVKPDEFYNAGAKLQVRFPIIVPFIFVGHLFPTKDYVAGLSSTAVLADFEIHKGVPAVSLFIQRMIFTVSYEGKIAYLHGDSWDIKRTEEIFKNVKEEDYSDALKFAADLYFSGNTGCLATEKLQLILGYTVIYRPNPRYNEKRTAFGFTARANY